MAVILLAGFQMIIFVPAFDVCYLGNGKYAKNLIRDMFFADSSNPDMSSSPICPE